MAMWGAEQRKLLSINYHFPPFSVNDIGGVSQHQAKMGSHAQNKVLRKEMEIRY